MRRPIVSVFLAASMAWLAAAPGPSETEGSVTRTSRPIRLLRSWEDTIKVRGREIPRRVEVVFDYSQGIARENSYGQDGMLMASRKFTQNLPAPSPEEIAEAFAITRADPRLRTLFARFEVVLEGGFLLQEDKGRPCGPQSRCLHVFLLSPDRSGLIRRVVVDLTDRSIPYNPYTPSTRRR